MERVVNKVHPDYGHIMGVIYIANRLIQSYRSVCKLCRDYGVIAINAGDIDELVVRIKSLLPKYESIRANIHSTARGELLQKLNKRIKNAGYNARFIDTDEMQITSRGDRQLDLGRITFKHEYDNIFTIKYTSRI
jgi:hypothetical protein